MLEMKTMIVLRLEGALQSWGDTSKWDYRESSDLPSKSGIVGLIGCAMGLERGSAELPKLAEAIRIAVRADRAGIRTVDYQTVTGAPLLNAEGKPKSTGNTIVSPREYLQDACFTVFISADDTWIDRIQAAFLNPKWCVYLGRKNCIPSRPVFEATIKEYDSLEEAVRNYPTAMRSADSMVFETEEQSSELSSYFRPDMNLLGERNFSMRHVWRGTVEEVRNVSVQN